MSDLRMSVVEQGVMTDDGNAPHMVPRQEKPYLEPSEITHSLWTVSLLVFIMISGVFQFLLCIFYLYISVWNTVFYHNNWTETSHPAPLPPDYGHIPQNSTDLTPKASNFEFDSINQIFHQFNTYFNFATLLLVVFFILATMYVTFTSISVRYRHHTVGGSIIYTCIAGLLCLCALIRLVVNSVVYFRSNASYRSTNANVFTVNIFNIFIMIITFFCAIFYIIFMEKKRIRNKLAN
mmetsp:Transcript_168/g.287  ORF Transcript_168/g.287 Transcript_168/m.287 type:complete len:236 (+) Transcript_168:108-815(+)